MTQDTAAPPGLILAGGRSSRMGTDKAFLTLAGDTMLAHIVRRLSPQVSRLALNAAPDFPNPLALPLLPDTIAGQAGPLAGVLAGLRDLQAGGSKDRILTVPCDSPFFPSDLVERLKANATHPDAIAVASAGGRRHPVFALWPVAIADDLETWLSDPDNRRINAFLDRHRAATVEFPFIETAEGPLDPFLNINTPEDLAEAGRFAAVLA
jgi:molybdopterin-guanine dinucleotide biosynthesis protein A